MSREKIEGKGYMDIRSKISDAGNSFAGLSFLISGDQNVDMEEIKKTIARMAGTYLMTLEDYTKENKKELEKIKPGICEEYNFLIKELQDENLTLEKLKEIIRRGMEIVKLNKT